MLVMADEGGNKGTCVICGVETSLKCQRCFRGGLPPPFYCGKGHQLEHLKKGGHKEECGKGTGEEGDSWEQTEEDVFLAKKDLPPGHFLFHRKPLLFFPDLPSPKDIMHHQNTGGRSIHYSEDTLVTCVGCLEVLPYGIGMLTERGRTQMTKCIKCIWPLHWNAMEEDGPSSCQKVHEAECKILCERGQKWDRISVNKEVEKYYYLALLRAAILPPDQMTELLSYPVPWPRVQILRFCEGGVLYCPNIIAFVREKCGIPIYYEDGMEILMTLLANMLANPTRNIASMDKVGYVMFAGGPTGLVLSHSCIPNCAPYVESDLSASFKTIREVKKGEILTINYSHHHKGIQDRQLDFHAMLRPFCKCIMCGDPTEGGTFYSAVKCKTCRQNYLLPTLKCSARGPERIMDLYTWKCQNTSCRGSLSQQAVNEVVQSLHLLMRKLCEGEGYAELKTFIERVSGNIVHPNHFIVTLAEFQLVALASGKIRCTRIHSSPNFQFDLHGQYLPDVDTALEKLKLIQPGRIPEYGELLYCQTQLRMSKMAAEVRDMDQDELDRQLKVLLRDMEESWTVISDNPITEKCEKIGDAKLRSLYANHLLKNIGEVFPNCNNFENVRILKSKYCNPHLHLRRDKLNYRQKIFFPANDVPTLKEVMNDPNFFIHAIANL